MSLAANAHKFSEKHLHYQHIPLLYYNVFIKVIVITAIVHAIHPWSAPFFLLVVFYLGATTATKV